MLSIAYFQFECEKKNEKKNKINKINEWFTDSMQFLYVIGVEIDNDSRPP